MYTCTYIYTYIYLSIYMYVYMYVANVLWASSRLSPPPSASLVSRLLTQVLYIYL